MCVPKVDINHDFRNGGYGDSVSIGALGNIQNYQGFARRPGGKESQENSKQTQEVRGIGEKVNGEDEVRRHQEG